MRNTVVAVLGILCLASPVHAASSGVLDASFGGGDGLAPLPTLLDRPGSVLQQPDQRLVVVGAGAVRLLADGSPDSSFAAGGIASSATVYANAAALQSDGAVVGAGRGTTLSGRSTFGVVRFAAGGVPDPSFGTNGEVIVDVGSDAQATAIAVQADGKIVVAGTRGYSPGAHAIVVRLEADGDLDPSFGANGIAAPAVTNLRLTSLVLQPGVGVVLGGAQNNRGVLLRLDEGGVIDASFGSGGIVDVSAYDHDEPGDLLRQPDGKLLAGGRGYDADVSTWHFRALLARFDADGAPDASFDGDGAALFPQLAALNAIALAPDGRIVGVPGVGTTSKKDFAIARFTEDGAIDASFGSGGFVSVALGDGPAAAHDALIQGDGNVALVGDFTTTSPYEHQTSVLARFVGASSGCASDADCALCESCVAGACAMSPRTGCVQASAGGARLDVAWAYDSALISRAVALVKWDWRGSTAPPATLLDPTTSDGVAACMFYGGSGWRALQTVAPAASSCGNRPCWSEKGAGGWRFRGDRVGSHDGLRSITIDAKRVKLDARGEPLEASLHGVPYPGLGSILFYDPSAPNLLNEDLVVQLQASSGACWSASYTSAASEWAKVTRTRIQYKATSD